MTIFTKDPTSPEGLAILKEDHKVLLEVTVRQLYVLHDGSDLTDLAADWFVRYNGRAHAYRDGSHVGGGDAVQLVRDLTDGGKVILSQRQIARARGAQGGCAAFSRGLGKPENPYGTGELALEWDIGYSEGFTKCGHDKQAAFEAEWKE